MRNAYRIFVGKPEEKDLVEDLGLDECMILKRIARKYFEIMEIGFIWIRIWPSGGYTMSHFGAIVSK
jgi:hypothetical protein